MLISGLKIIISNPKKFIVKQRQTNNFVWF